MFAVRCPASMVWHPAVHHSLLLLRALEQPHTLLLDPHTVSRGRLPVPLLSQCATAVRIQVPSAHSVGDSSASTSAQRTVVLYKAEDLLHIVRTPLSSEGGSSDVATAQPAIPASLLEYLETSTVCSHMASAVDSLLVSLNSGSMEAIRQTHARVMELVERLETSVADDRREAGHPVDEREPLSTWPLFCTLQFLIEEGGLLTSAFPRTSGAYARICRTSTAVAHHRRLVQRTVEEQLGGAAGASSSAGEGAQVEHGYPAKGFLRDVQRHLASYNQSTEERITDGVSGERGPLNSRTSGGRLGVQAVQARMPWTLQGRPLRKG
ncbi:hypothetical protein NESM_000636800 [Novymonas esmeraldas]|uniref:Uncharacterized protein n=1 Tax=Novymonas esmeraldas TaxID=1808958 RepID=A0AAW0ETS7_9TRYP